MKRRKYIYLILAIFFIAIPFSLILRKPSPLDLSNDEEPFKSMALPPKSVWAEYYMDGGSIVVQVIDHNGTHHVVKFPFDHDGLITSYKTAFEISSNNRKSRRPLKDTARAKKIMIRLLQDYGDKRNENYEFTLRKFSEPPSEIGQKAFEKTKTFFTR